MVIYSRKKDFTDRELNKLGNTIIYLIDKIQFLTKKKCLTLLYLLDEHSIKTYSKPFSVLEYKVWQYGPIAEAIFNDLSERPVLLADYINVSSKFFSTNRITNNMISKLKDFCDDEFSDNDIEILDYIIENYGEKSLTELSKITQNPNSIWYISAKENGLLELFKSSEIVTSNYVIDFSLFLEIDKKEIYNSYNEHRSIERLYNR